MEKKEFTKKEQLLSGLVFVGVLTFIGIVFASIIWSHFSMKESIRTDEENRIKVRQKRTAEVFGTITDYSETRGSGTAKDKRIEFQFVVNGKTYNDSQYADSYTRFDFNYKKGVEGKVCYDPSNPEDAKFYPKIGSEVCGE